MSVRKPETDARDYRVVELSNQLSVLLVSDPSMAASEAETHARGARDCGCWPSVRSRPVVMEPGDDGAAAATDDGAKKKAACAICVGVGYLSDPPSLEGCAHFVEHMLFMGTREFPNENGWNSHLSRYGGADNGETEAETTVFYFDVAPSQLRESLRRFASFFSCPLFKWSGSRREVKAIHSEFEQAAQDDYVREWQVLSSLTQPGHPYHRFGWGNKKSLVDVPKAKHVDVRAELGSVGGVRGRLVAKPLPTQDLSRSRSGRGKTDLQAVAGNLYTYLQCGMGAV